VAEETAAVDGISWGDGEEVAAGGYGLVDVLACF